MLMRCAGLGGSTDAVDIFDVTSGRWTTAALSSARSVLAATSLPDQGLAIFAGGQIGTHVVLVLSFVDVGRWCDVGVGGACVWWK